MKLTTLIFAAFSIISLLFSSIPSVYSQAASPSPSANSAQGGSGFNLEYPIEDLGGCANLDACTNYCSDPTHYNSCTDFAKKQGFYKDDVTEYADDEFWNETKTELGCDSKDSCMSFCTQEANFAACESFAKRNDIPGGYVDNPDKPEYIEKAKEVLGCDSPASCATFCDNQANADKCSEFANKVGLIGGKVTEGPGGCQTPETCRAYCSDPANFEQCKAAEGGNFTGPNGCADEATCRTTCEQNPEICRSYAPGSNGAYVPITCGENEVHGPGGSCTKIPDYKIAANCVDKGGYWNDGVCNEKVPFGVTPELTSAHFEERPEMGNCKTPGECYDYCKDNQVNGASVCPGFDASAPRSTDEFSPYLYYTPGSEVTHDAVESMGGCTSPASCYDYCKENKGKCEGFSDKAPRPPEVYIPGTYYTPPADTIYVTPPVTAFYTTPIYYTPSEGSTYTTPQYYTPGMYSTPSYQTPPQGSNYTTPNYYTPGSQYVTPTGEYPTPTYNTPTYYTPPGGTNYTTPYYYTPPTYMTPYYYTPGTGGIAANYTTPNYVTPPPYATPQYYTPYTGGSYTTPVYFTPPTYTTPNYQTPPAGSSYTSPSYYTPPATYTTPRYYTPGTYPTPPTYNTPAAYTTPNYLTPPPGSNYTTPQYYTPAQYSTPTYYSPTNYTTPSYNSPYITPTYPAPPAGSSYTSPSYYTPYNTPGGSYYSPSSSSGYSYPSPNYVYPSPSGTGVSYYTPNSSYTYPSPTDGYVTPAYNSPYVTPSSGSGYPTPNYQTPPTNYPTPVYNTPSYNTPSYNSPAPPPPPPSEPAPPPPPPQSNAGAVAGESTSQGLLQQALQQVIQFLRP